MTDDARAQILASETVSKSCAHLPRLAPEYYRGLGMVHWTLSIEHRATGWLTPEFHNAWQLLLVHASARYQLICPAYVLMPDHAHLMWIGISKHADQRTGLESLRRNLSGQLLPARWQRQAYDHVLRAGEKRREAVTEVARYVFENPVRRGIVSRFSTYPFLGCCVPGYPELSVRAPDYWERFWRVFGHLVAG